MQFHEYPLWINLIAFAVAAVIVWLAGSQLAKTAEKMTSQTRLSSVLAGALLLGGATSLPEIATTASASWLGNAPLAVNNLFGGVAMQIAVLAIIDFCFVRSAPLTFLSPDPVLLLGGVFLILQITLSIVAVSSGDVAIVQHVGAWPVVLVGAYVLALYFMSQFSERESWTPANTTEIKREEKPSAADETQEPSLAWLIAQFVFHSFLVLVSGWIVSSTADALSVQTGIGSGFLGATLVATATSLPEISTTAGAVRLGAYTMAISNIFGTNSLEIALLFVSDVAYLEGPVINSVGDSALLMAGTGIVLTCLYLWGLLERRDKSYFHAGFDSWYVMIVYLVSLFFLYHVST